MSPAGNPLEGIFRMLSAPDEVVRRLGVKALGDIPPGRLAELLRDPGLSPAAKAFLCPAESAPPAVEPVPPVEGGEEGEPEGKPPQDDDSLNTYQRIQKMNAGQKIKTAFKGDKEARGLLIRDSNREVYMSVLENPGLTESEVELFAKNSGTNADILRKIARNKDWMANHSILRGLVTNPKCPVEVSARFLSHLTDKELEILETSKNLPSVLRTNAKRLIQSRKKKGG